VGHFIKMGASDKEKNVFWIQLGCSGLAWCEEMTRDFWVRLGSFYNGMFVFAFVRSMLWIQRDNAVKSHGKDCGKMGSFCKKNFTHSFIAGRWNRPCSITF
jgi:hypothetical protein